MDAHGRRGSEHQPNHGQGHRQWRAQFERQQEFYGRSGVAAGNRDQRWRGKYFIGHPDHSRQELSSAVQRQPERAHLEQPGPELHCRSWRDQHHHGPDRSQSPALLSDRGAELNLRSKFGLASQKLKSIIRASEARKAVPKTGTGAENFSSRPQGLVFPSFEALRLSMPVEVSKKARKAGVLILLALSACCDKQASNAAPTPPALYGPPQNSPSQSIPRLRPMAPKSAEALSRAPFSCVETELSPATLYHSSTHYISFFTGLHDYGLGGPKFAAFNTPTGPSIYTNNQAMDVRWIEENWVLVWFNGAKGWTNWDSPWVVYLQHKPIAIKLDDNGLHFEFPGPAGDLVLLPLYG